MKYLKSIVNALFDSPYFDKADVAYILTAAVVLFKLPLQPDQQAALVALLGLAYVVAHKLSQALATPTAK